MAVAVGPKHTCGECVFYKGENGYCDEWKIHVDNTEPNCPRFMLATDGGPVIVTRLESVQPDECKTSESKSRHRNYHPDLTNTRVAELILAGKTQKQIAKEYGMTPQAICRLVQQAVDEGLLVKTGNGWYVAPDNAGQASQQRTETADASTADAIESLREDLVILGEWAIRLDKRCEQLERRIEQLQDAIIERLAAVGISIASVQRDVGAIENEIPNNAIDKLLDVIETQQAIIRNQLAGGRCE